MKTFFNQVFTQAPTESQPGTICCSLNTDVIVQIISSKAFWCHFLLTGKSYYLTYRQFIPWWHMFPVLRSKCKYVRPMSKYSFTLSPVHIEKDVSPRSLHIFCARNVSDSNFFFKLMLKYGFRGVV